MALLFIRGRSLPVRHTPWGQRSTLAIAVSLFVTWLSSMLPIPTPLLVGLYGGGALAGPADCATPLLRRGGPQR